MARYNTNGSSALAPNDPYNDMDSADIRPEFQVINGNKSTNPSRIPSNRDNFKVLDGGRFTNAQNTLRKLENAAITNNPVTNAPWKNNVQGKKDPSQKPSIKNKTKKRIALIILLACLGGGAVFLGSSHSLLAPALQTLITEATDTQYAALANRSPYIMRYALEGEGAITSSWGKTIYGKMSTGFKARLAKQGIEVNGSGRNKSLTFTTTASNGVEVVTEIPAEQFVEVYKNNTEFRDAYNTAKRGRVASFFDQAASKVYKFLGISRNDYVDYKQTGNAAVDDANYKENLSSRFDGDSTSIHRTTIEEQQQYDEKGNPLNETKPGVSGSDDGNGRVSTDVDSAKTGARSIINAMSSKISSAVNVGCGVLAISSMISTLIAANEIYQSINYFLNNSENLSKMMAGYGDESAINSFLNFITTPATTNVMNFGKGKVGVISGTLDQGNLELGFTDGNGETTLTGSFVEGNASQMVLANAPGSSTTTDLFSFERTGNAISRLLGSLTAGAVSYKACNVAKIGASALSIAVTLSPAGILAITSNLVFSCLTGVALTLTANLLLGFLIPVITNTLTNPVAYLIGKASSAVYIRGGDEANARLGQTGSGQGPMSQEAYTAYNRLTQEVLALDAEVDRKNHSPFDITNHNTFLGNIAYRFLLPLSTSSSLTTNSTNFLRTTSTSIASIISPNTYASGSSYTYASYNGECDNLSEIDASGSIFCSARRGTDITTMDISPNDPEYIDVIENGRGNGPNLDCSQGDFCTIVPNSNLDFYQQDCAGRTSPLGVVDQNILNRHVLSGKISVLLGKLGDALPGLPLIGEFMDLADGAQTVLDETTLMWANGAICVNSPQNKYWDEMKYYQRYMEDVRSVSQITADSNNQVQEGDDEESEETAFFNPVLANYERYTSENPITSYADYLSRISGLTIDNVETVLALVDYYNYINDYSPDARVALNEHQLTDTTSTDIIANFQHNDFRFIEDQAPIDDAHEDIIITKEYVIYSDLRSRNYVA